MPFVKLDTGILESTLWIDRECREIFLTALLLAEPLEIDKPMEQIAIRSLERTGFMVPPGWYGFARAASVGIIGRALVEMESGMAALERLGNPDLHSRSAEFDGRRMIRVDGGFIILNYMKYRDRDYSAAERQRRFRKRRKDQASQASLPLRDSNVTSRNITQAEAEAEVEVEAEVKLSTRFTPPTLKQVQSYCAEKAFGFDPERFIDYYTSKGWKVGRASMKDWKAAARNWAQNNFENSKGKNESKGQQRQDSNRRARDGAIAILRKDSSRP